MKRAIGAGRPGINCHFHQLGDDDRSLTQVPRLECQIGLKTR